MVKELEWTILSTHWQAWRRVAVLSTLISFFGGTLLIATSPEEGLRLTFSADPGESILRVAYEGGTSGMKFSFTLYGDGRLEYKSSDIHGNSYEDISLFIDFKQMDDLLRLVARYNLVESTRGDVERRLMQTHKRGRLPWITDAGSMTIEVSLTSYRRNGRQQGAMTNSITLHAPVILSEQYDLEELRGCAEINDRMIEFRRLARESIAKTNEN